MNIPLTGTSGDKNRKRPRLSTFATATLLLSAISFVGVGAILQPQAFAQEVPVDQSIEQVADLFAAGGEGSSVSQSIRQFGSNFAAVEDEDGGSSVSQSITQEASSTVEAGGNSDSTQSTEQFASNVADLSGVQED
jgi:hypothetical protein